MKKRSLFVVVLLFMFVAASNWFLTIPLNIIVSGEQAEVRFELLGDYPRNINLIEIVDVHKSQTVWRVVAKGEFIQLHGFKVVAGLNSSSLETYWGSAVTTNPQSPSLFLDPKKPYKIIVCSSTWWEMCASEVIKLG